ncbi:MAG TPA: hypothetical protein VGK38_11680, partial [Prolixibacteraceae bacterium]
METQLIIGLVVFNLLITILLLFQRSKKSTDLPDRIDALDKSLTKIEAGLREDFRINREENSNIAKENRSELNATLKDFQRELALTLKEITSQSKSDSLLQRDTLINSFKGFQETFDKNVESFNQLQREKFTFLGEEQKRMVDSTEKRLEEIRVTVDEKLQKTLNERLGQSFELVVRQLENVQKGLG